MDMLKAKIVTIIVLNLDRKDLSFYYTATFRGPSMAEAIYSSFRR